MQRKKSLDPFNSDRSKVRPDSALNSLNKMIKNTKASVFPKINNNNPLMNVNNSLSPDKLISSNKTYPNKYSQESINFDFDEYGLYPDENFQPSVFFFKFLAPKSDLNDNKRPKLKLYVPDTIVLNDVETNYWMFTDFEGNVTKVDLNSDAAVLDKFRSSTNDNTELLGIAKNPIFSKKRFIENRSELLSYDELERNLLSKNSGQFAIQRFVKCKGPKAFICRTVWRRDKPSYSYILTNKFNYKDSAENNMTKFVVSSKLLNTYHVFYSTSGKHLEETMKYMNNIVKFIETHSDIVFEELVGDFVKDQADIWWFINLKAMKIKNINKFLDNNLHNISFPNLEYFIHRRRNKNATDNITKKFDYQTLIKCKFCGIDYSAGKLKHNLTTKMIFETDKMLKHLGNSCSFTDRPDLKHSDPSMIYLPYRVCEDCYLLFETTNDIKNYQIDLANYFGIPVDPINFGMYYTKKESTKMLPGSKREEKKYGVNQVEISTQEVYPTDESEYIADSSHEYIQTRNSQSTNKIYHMHRILIMFTDLFLNENVKLPEKELYLRFNFLGDYYKVKIGKYYEELDYCNINFFKIFYIICEESKGFIEYVDQNKHLDVQLGYYKNDKEGESGLKNIPFIFNQNIVIEDKDICIRREDFVEFAKVELSLQGLKYGEKYRNTLNGLMFKQEHPHYVARLRCMIRISNEGRENNQDKYKDGKECYKNIDVTKLNYRKHFNFYIPPINFVISDELQDYWLELIERHKLRENILNTIMKTMKNNSIIMNKKEHKDSIFQSLETLVSHYLNKSTEHLFNSYK